MMVAMVFTYVQKFGASTTGQEEDDDAASTDKKPAKKKKAGMLEGLKLIIQHYYIQGITVISCVFMVEVTILDYAMKVLAKDKFTSIYPDDPVAATQAFARFMGFFGQFANGLTFLFSIVGTSFVIRRLGLPKTLVLFPSMLIVVCFVILAIPSLETVFVAMLLLKALSYALNNPCKEMLYQPTNKAVKFKAKSWIDIFGQRGAKALGSTVTFTFAESASALLQNGMLISIGLSAGLVYVSNWMGKKFTEYTDEGYKVGDDKVPAAAQSSAEDTSCGLEEEGQADGTKTSKEKNKTVSV